MIYLIAAVILYSLVIIFSSVAAKNLNSNLMTAIANSIAAIIPIGVVFTIFDKKMLANPKVGIAFAILAGISIALFTLTLNKSLTVNKVGIVAPVVWGGAIFLSTLLGVIFLKEKVTLLHSIGLAFLGIGFLVIIYAKAAGN